MLDALFGTELSTPVKFAIAFPIILALLVGFIYAVRRFGVGALGSAVTTRGRQPRLGVTDVAMVGDGRRRLLLIRRDNVEHLIMTGGPSDIVIEQNIVRATPAVPVRETPPARVTADALPRAVPLAENGMWPLQPEPIVRPQRAAAPVPEDDREDAPWAAQAEAAPRAPERENGRENGRDNGRDNGREITRETAKESMRETTRESIKDNVVRVQTSDRLSGLVADLSRNFVDTEPPSAPPPRRNGETRRTAPQAVPSLSPNEEQNLAEMAQRLESVLQRPRSAGEPAAPPSPPAARPDIAAVPAAPRPEPVVKPVPKPPVKVAPKAAFDSLEQEMASLLGRPSAKT
jgi:hypothetical protein